MEKGKKIALVFSAIFVAGIIVGCILLVAQDENAKSGAKIDQYIEKCDFVAARNQLDKMREHLNEINSNIFSGDDEKEHYQTKYDEYVLKVSQAQISYMIGKGDFETAQDIAYEDKNYAYYFNSILRKLVVIYNDSQYKGVISALVTISIPNIGDEQEIWDGHSHHYSFEQFYQSDINNIITSYNDYLNNLMSYLKANGDDDALQSISSFLKPLYKKVKKKENMIWEGIPSDYTQANQIKKEWL